MIQWIRTCLPTQVTRVQSLVWEDPTCLGATKAHEPQLLSPHLGPVSNNCGAFIPKDEAACPRAPEIQLLGLGAATPEAHVPQSLCSVGNKRSHCSKKPLSPTTRESQRAPTKTNKELKKKTKQEWIDG